MIAFNSMALAQSKGAPIQALGPSAALASRRVKLQANRLELDGVRVADVYDIKASKFSSVRTSQKVRIVVDRDAQSASLDSALSRVFLTGLREAGGS